MTGRVKLFTRRRTDYVRQDIVLELAPFDVRSNGAEVGFEVSIGEKLYGGIWNIYTRYKELLPALNLDFVRPKPLIVIVGDP